MAQTITLISSRSQAINGSLVETFEPYSRFYTKVAFLLL
jgi:hypothetical protein